MDLTIHLSDNAIGALSFCGAGAVAIVALLHFLGRK